MFFLSTRVVPCWGVLEEIVDFLGSTSYSGHLDLLNTAIGSRAYQSTSGSNVGENKWPEVRVLLKKAHLPQKSTVGNDISTTP